MEVLEFDEEFDPTRCPVCGADGYVDDEGIVRCSSCFAELPGDGLDWDAELVWADDGATEFEPDVAGPVDTDAVAADPEDFLAPDQRGPIITERSRRRDALVRRSEFVVDREVSDDDLVDGFVDREAPLDDDPDRVTDDDLYL